MVDGLWEGDRPNLKICSQLRSSILSIWTCQRLFASMPHKPAKHSCHKSEVQDMMYRT